MEKFEKSEKPEKDEVIEIESKDLQTHSDTQIKEALNHLSKSSPQLLPKPSEFPSALSSFAHSSLASLSFHSLNSSAISFNRRRAQRKQQNQLQLSPEEIVKQLAASLLKRMADASLIDSQNQFQKNPLSDSVKDEPQIVQSHTKNSIESSAIPQTEQILREELQSKHTPVFSQSDKESQPSSSFDVFPQLKVNIDEDPHISLGVDNSTASSGSVFSKAATVARMLDSMQQSLACLEVACKRNKENVISSFPQSENESAEQKNIRKKAEAIDSTRMKLQSSLSSLANCCLKEG
eukprot:MONOS_7964.1-p1 / transcript=MONOS_7964.1 / gene=MONOS_7964 / organism=Monocercomonoides_exilis_PA203 / gene_product=unspecified product / transcript_product=unspecified product / location=Mono_scaffold00287:57780-58658(+) / protein_length=293 / sequence_SO=supercontig / SO=protein_coding / is_pseudo=false